MKKTSLNLRVAHFNCNGLRNRDLLIGKFLNKVKPDILSLNEIRCSDPVAKNLLRFKGYLAIFKCRAKKARGGSLALLIHESMESVEVKLPFDLEIVCYKIKLNDKSIHIISFYNPPEQKLNKDIFEYCERNFTDYLILGDLNARIKPLNNKTNGNGNILSSIINNSNAFLLNDKIDPTNLTFRKNILSTSVIDVGIGTEFFRDSLESYSTLKNSILNSKDKLNHHVPIMFTFKISYKRRELTQQTSSFYLYDKANWKKFEEEVNAALEKIEDNEITILSNKIHESIRKSAMRNIPKKNGLQKSPSLPKHILDLIKCRKNLQKKYNKSRSLFDKENLYSIVDTIEIEIKKYKSDLWNKFIDKMQQKNRYILGTIPFWKRINNLRKQKTKKGMATLINEGKRIECDFEKAELFGNRLEQIFSEDNNPRYDNNHRDKVNKYLNLKKYEEEYTQNEKVTKFITEKELKIAIKNLNKKIQLTLRVFRT